MKSEVIVFLSAVSLPLISWSGASGQSPVGITAGNRSSHNLDGPHLFIIYGDCRTAILKAAGVAYYDSQHPLTKKPVSCMFTLKKSGYIDRLRILRTSGDKVVDLAALDIVRKAVPFKAQTKYEGALIASFEEKNGVSVYP